MGATFQIIGPICLAIALGGCQPNYPGAGYVGLGMILDSGHAAAQEQSRDVERQIGMRP